ncbi:MAG: DUF2851 family protein [Bacteroidales bacterium]|nr:DUF2851 family protein [Bacteroidales bacterium]
MKEEFLHFLWKYSLYDKEKLLDNDGNRIIVIHPGEYNRDAGPAYFSMQEFLLTEQYGREMLRYISVHHILTCMVIRMTRFMIM